MPYMFTLVCCAYYKTKHQILQIETPETQLFTHTKSPVQRKLYNSYNIIATIQTLSQNYTKVLKMVFDEILLIGSIFIDTRITG